MDKVEQGKIAKKRTIAEIRAAKKPVTKAVPIQLDGGVASRLAELREMLEDARRTDAMSNAPDAAHKIQAEIDELVEASKETEQVFTFKSVGRHRYDEIVSKPTNRPNAQQKKEGMDFNPNNFPPELVAECCVDPEMTHEEAKEIFIDEEWNAAELQRLFYCALEVNNETGDVPLSKSGSDMTLTSLLNSVIQQNEESPTPSS